MQLLSAEVQRGHAEMYVYCRSILPERAGRLGNQGIRNGAARRNLGLRGVTRGRHVEGRGRGDGVGRGAGSSLGWWGGCQTEPWHSFTVIRMSKVHSLWPYEEASPCSEDCISKGRWCPQDMA